MLAPVEGRVLIRLDEPATETSFGLALPEQAQGKSEFGTIVAVGRGTPHPRAGLGLRLPDEKLLLGEHVDDAGFLRSLEAGMRVVLPKWGGSELEHEGETLVSITAPEILAVIA